MSRLELPLSVWPTAQTSPRWQREGRYLPASITHPAKMLPSLARHAIGAYTLPGDLILDPMAGIGTTLVEAIHLGRHAIGIELEPRWAKLAAANLDRAAAIGATGGGTVLTGDACQLGDLLPVDQRGRVALVLTSPPYGPARLSNHGRARTRPGHGVTKWGWSYSTNPANLGNQNHRGMLAGMAQIIAGCAQALRPGGLLVLTARPWRRDGALVDTPGALAKLAEDTGLIPLERNVALLAGLRDDHLIPRQSFFALHEVRRLRDRGVPVHIVAHEDVLVFRRRP